MKKLLCVCFALWLLTGVCSAAERYVALTFDDGPSGKNTEALCEVLEERGVKATFFLCGYRIESFPELPKQLSRAGHELGVHGYSHTCFDALTPAALREELRHTGELIETLSGQRPRLVRPPCGAWDAAVRAQARDAGLSLILWSVDPEDWNSRDSEKIAHRVCEQVEDGSIILMHDMHPSSVAAAAALIDCLQAEDVHFVTVSELAARSGCELCAGEAYHQFPIEAYPSEIDSRDIAPEAGK